MMVGLCAVVYVIDSIFQIKKCSTGNRNRVMSLHYDFLDSIITIKDHELGILQYETGSFFSPPPRRRLQRRCCSCCCSQAQGSSVT